MPFANEHAARLREPGDFKDESFRRVERKSATFDGRIYHVIRGRLKSNDEWEDQAFRYPAKSWPEADARKHAKAHSAKGFEAATGGASAVATEFMLVEAEAARRLKVIGTAYSGGKLQILLWDHPLVVDLISLEIHDSTPLLANHENRTSSRVGLVHAEVEGGFLQITGEILSSNQAATEIIEQLEAGGEWQLSIGVGFSQEPELVKNQRIVNGQTFKGPFYHVKQSVLKEVSIVPVAADINTSLRIAAKFEMAPPDSDLSAELADAGADESTTPKGSSKMAENKNKEASAQEPKAPEITREFLAQNHAEIVKAIEADAFVAGQEAERDRIQAIEKVPALGHEAIVAKAKADGEMTAEKLGLQILGAEGEQRKGALETLTQERETPIEGAAHPPPPPATPAKTEAEALADKDKPIAERAKAAWDGDAELRAEFSGSYETYLAYATADDNNRIRVLGK